MKKYLIIAAAALVASAACTKSEKAPEADQLIPVTFELANYKAQSKAADPSAPAGSFLRINDSFSSRAFLHGQGVDLNSDGTVNGTSFQNFFGSATPWTETISWDSSNKKWAPSVTYYWPKGTQSFVNFVSWYGATPTISYAYTSSKWTATMDFNLATLADDADILYADMAWRFKENVSTYHKDDAGVVGVPTLFHHALSQITVEAYVDASTTSAGLPADANSKWTVSIENFKIGTVSVGGTLHLTNADPGTATTTQAWTASLSSPSSNDITAATTNITSINAAAATPVIALKSVLPQTIANTVKMTADVRIIDTNLTSGATHEEVIPLEFTLAAFGTSEWVLNTHYTYRIKIQPSTSEVLYDPAVDSDWLEVVGTLQTL